MREWLKQASTDRGLTMKELSERLGISEGDYCYIEQGLRQKKMDIVLIGGLSSALNIPISDVVRQEAEYAES